MDDICEIVELLELGAGVHACDGGVFCWGQSGGTLGFQQRLGGWDQPWEPAERRRINLLDVLLDRRLANNGHQRDNVEFPAVGVFTTRGEPAHLAYAQNRVYLLRIGIVTPYTE